MENLTLDEYWKMQDLVECVFQFYKFNKCETQEQVVSIDKTRKQVIKMMEYAWDLRTQKNSPIAKED